MHKRGGFSLVEMLVVFGILTVLIALTVPAVQRIRLLAGRVACANNLKQQGLAIHAFAENNRGRMPMLGEAERGAHWTVFILSYIDQDSLLKKITYTNEGAQFARASGNFYPSIESGDLSDRNMAVCRQPMRVYNCPSAFLQQPLLDGSAYRPVWYNVRLPGHYLGVVTGLQPHDGRVRGSMPDARALSELDGMFIVRANPNHLVQPGGMASLVSLGEVPDGMSNTVMVGEADPDPFLPQIAVSMENLNVGRKDHWYFGGDDMDNYEGIDWSECGGSTAVRINYPRPTNNPFDPCSPSVDGNPQWGAYEVSYGSKHGGGANFLFADGSVKYLRETIDPQTFSALGTRANNDKPGDY